MDWLKRQLKLIDTYTNRLTRLYAEEYKKVLKEIEALILELYAKILDEGDPLLSHLYQYKRYYKLTKEIQAKLTELGIKQERLFTQEMTEFYKKNIAILDDQFETPFKITDEQIQEIIQRDLIENTLWQESIWKDKAILLSKMRHELISHLATGKPLDKMAEALQPETITSNFYNAKRLVRTEVVKYYVKSTIDKYKAEGITHVVYHCVDDDRTCELCREKNNTVMPIDSKDLPPTHPQCRCWITPEL